MNSERLEKLLKYYRLDPSNDVLLADILQCFLEHKKLDLLMGFVSEHGLINADISAANANKITNVYLYVGDYEVAAKWAQYAWSQDKNKSELIYNYAYSLYALNMFNQADKFLQEQSVDDTDHSIDIYLIHSKVCHHLADLERAKMYAEKAHKINPESSEANGYLALIYLDTGEYEAAIKLCEGGSKGISTEKTIAYIGSLIALGKFDEARIVLASGFDDCSSNGRLWLYQAQLQMLEQSYPEANYSLQKASQYMPAHIGTWHLLGWNYLITNDYSKARKAFESAYDIDRNFADSHAALAMMDIIQNNTQSARERIKRAVKLDSKSPTVIYAQSLLLEHDGDVRKATWIMKKLMSSEQAQRAIVLAKNITNRL